MQLAQVKEDKGRGKNKGGNGGGRGRGGKGKDPRADALNQYRELKKREYLTYKTASGRVICSWFQTGNCRNGNQCTFEHVCIRCHLLGHGVLDGECKAIPKLKGK